MTCQVSLSGCLGPFRDGPLFFPQGGGGGGYHDWEKNCLHETTYVMQDLGNLKKLSAQQEWRKKLASAQSMVEKNFLPPRNHDTSQGK